MLLFLRVDTDLLKKLDPLFSQYNPLYYKKGQIILRPEDNIDHIYFLEKGYVRFYSLTEDGKELTFLIYKPGYLFPVIYTFFGKKTKYYFEAVTPIVVRRAPREVFTKLVASNPALIFSLSQEIVVRLNEALDRMQFMAFMGAGSTIAYIIYSCARQFGHRKGSTYIIDLPLTHREIASMAGVARETVSIEMKKFEEEGLIFYKRNRISVRNLPKFMEKFNI